MTKNDLKNDLFAFIETKLACAQMHSQTKTKAQVIREQQETINSQDFIIECCIRRLKLCEDYSYAAYIRGKWRGE